MKHTLFCALCASFLLFLLLLGSNDSLPNMEISKVIQAPARRFLLSFPANQDTALIAALDGTINLVYRDSSRIIWSIASGSPIYHSYQAPINHDDDKENASGFGGRYFVDCGDDSKLFTHRDSGIRSMDMTFEVFTTHVSEDCGIILGSKKTTAFVVEADSGILIQVNYSSPGPSASQHTDLESKTRDSFSMSLPWLSKADVHRLSTPQIVEIFKMLGGHKLKLMAIPANEPLLPNSDTSKKYYRDNDFETETTFSFPSMEHDPEIPGPHDLRKSNYRVGVLAERRISYVILVVLIIANGFLVYSHHTLMATMLNKQPGGVNGKSSASRRKRHRKSEKTEIGNGKGSPLKFSDLLKCDMKGRFIGELFVSNKEIAKGSNGTIVLEGIYEGRKVAVKRLVRAHHDVAFKEIQNLIASDQHSNIVRWYGVKYDRDFVYLSLERCACSLYDLIQMYSESFQKARPPNSQVLMNDVMHDIHLWRPNGYPSPILVKLMRDIVAGLVHLHELGIIHRDLKPHNVLIVKEKGLCGKLSDMGISRRLVGDMSSLGCHATGCGSSGWQAPELLLRGRQTRAVDLFSLGCVLFYCITCGKHPFGEHLERDVNVANNRVSLFFVEQIPEAVDLFLQLLNPNAKLRPKASEVLHHPFFWNSEMRMSFLRDTSDRIELEGRKVDSIILRALESNAPEALGGKWDKKMEHALLANMKRYRRYKKHLLRDLLRVIRNTLNHYRQLPKDIQELLGSVPEGVDDYFTSRFPKLLMEVYNVMYHYCKEEKWFYKYLDN